MKKSSGLNQERNMHRSSIVYKWNQSITFLNKYVGGFWCERQQRINIFTGWSIIMDYGQTKQFEVKNVLIMDLFFTNTQPFTSQDVSWWTGVVWITCGLLWCFYQLFGPSFWRHPFTAEDPLVNKWCNAKFGLRVSTFSAKFWNSWPVIFYAGFIGTLQQHFPQCISADWPGVPPRGSCCSLGPGSCIRGNRLSVCQSRSLLGLSSDFSRAGAFLGLYVKRRW